MKSIVNRLVFIYFKIKNFFFNCINLNKKENKNSVQAIGNEQVNINDEYHTAFSGVTRWQTL